MRLKAVIVHSGGPEVGHYWVVVRSGEGWVKVDDSKVAAFYAANMDKECFGGTMQTESWDGMPTSANAYVLLYEKYLKEDIVLGQNESKRLIPFDKI